MSAAFYVCFLLWCFQTNTAGAQLPPPHNLNVISMNTNYTLIWDWDQGSAESGAVNFTTHYVAKFMLRSKKKSPNWNTGCETTSHRSCDLTNKNLFYLGIYVFRVRASVNGTDSDWAMKDFCPDEEAALGPPSKVALSPEGRNLDIVISDPLSSTNRSMREHHEDLYFQIRYWERSADGQALRGHSLSSKKRVVTLSNLQAWTSYCVRVQSRYDFYNKSSSFTPPLCTQTEGTVPWWEIVLYFLLSLVICFLVVLLFIYGFFRCFKKLKATFYPSVQLPTPFQYLCDSSGSDIPRLLPESDSELLCDKVTVCPAPPLLEIHSPPPEFLPEPTGLEPDSSGKHSRSSSGSGDSGMYSTGGGSSNLRQQHSGQDSQGPLDSEQVKMQDMAPGLKTHLLAADEGIVDMCV
ncbi:hypothetical protein JOQ06_030546 [Pogonophryne albipinna]|uniref:Fibronectin type-III domain-containing protein n=1 Tax=Pogonophryne albipinna TaxID=1090488 RepID=A0AAD6AZD3_9TELE|nr:hypothetical protein JOQ06_030546 [Pogonophryne albipinna]